LAELTGVLVNNCRPQQQRQQQQQQQQQSQLMIKDTTRYIHVRRITVS